MDKKQAINLVEQTFPQPFDKDQFHQFVAELLHRLDDSPERQSRWAGQFIKKAYQDYVNHYERLGTYTDPEGRKLDLLVIHLKKDTTLERGRTRLRNFAADYLSTGHGNDKDAVLAAYVSPEEDDWRFSFVKLEYALEQDETGRVKERKDLTPARRYSFLVGANEHSHTAQKQFLPLLMNDQSDPSLADIEEAFDIEKVTKEFFGRYRELFENTKAALDNLIERDARALAEVKDKSIETDDFAKKLLGQIVFLYFLQKKGWFGVERGAAWGTGDKQYLRYLFDNCERLGRQQGKAKKQTVNFFNDILEHLFYEALATERTNHYYGRFDCRIPFLNGGLFEPLQGYNWDSVDILLPNELFSNDELTKDGDIGTGILDVFDRYNFTVNEAEPLETEVAVDPEMLGKVFENLLPENIRHKGGTYYTPRVVVHYMCQQSLINYLALSLEGKVGRENIEALITRGERHADFEANPNKEHKNKLLPGPLRQHAKEIDRLLAKITVCDPAIGSGAFPVGMMQEIVKSRLTLADVEGMPARKTYDLKRHAIENSLYGVDIDPGAIEIARLRLWLSLIVDEDKFQQIQPLPNLDYKIMQGNSLLEEFEGVKLIQDSLILQAFHDKEAQITELNNQINQLEREAVIAGSQEGKRSPKFLKMQDDLAQRKKKRDALYLQDDKPQLQMGLLDSSKLLGERLSELEKLRQRYLDYHSISEKKNKLREEIEIREWEIVEQVLTGQGKKDALRELARHRRDNKKNYFLWKFYFSQVFRINGGFDVVIGNPPYLNVERVSPETKRAYAANFQTFYKRYDVFGLFFEQALTRLVKGGTIAFIVPSQILNNISYKKLRDLMLSNEWLREVFYLGDKVFEAANNDVCVLFMQKPKTEKIKLVNALNFSNPTATEVPSNYFDKFERVISFSADAASDWIFDKIFNPSFLRLRESFDLFQGIVTGNNDAFLPTIDQIKSARLEKALLHRVLLGRDFEKWYIRNAERKILYVDASTEIRNFPNALAWLLPFRSQLEKRRECERDVIPWYALQWARNKSQLDYVPKILVQRTRNPRLKTRIVAAVDEVGFYAMESVIILIPKGAPESVKFLLGILNSKVINYVYQTKFLNVAVKAEYLRETPIPMITLKQQEVITKLVDYILFSKAITSENESRDQMMVSYFEQLIDALVYELYLPDEIHVAGKQFFAPLIAERLPALDEIKGDKLEALRRIFERLYDRNHVIRKNIFFLDTIESVRIIEGKA